MHVYGVGMTGKIGSGVHELLTKKYNPERGRREGRNLDQKNVPATINAEVLAARVTMDSNRVAKIQRPFITVDSELLDVWGDVGSGVDHVSFLPNNRPSLTYDYPLNDEEVKGLVDAGLYRNPQFEILLNTLMKQEQFELTKDVTVQSIELEKDDTVVPMIIVHDIGRVKQETQSLDGSEIAYTSFNSVIERTIDMALQLESEGMTADDLNNDNELDTDREVTVEFDDVFDANKVAPEVVVEDEDFEDVAIDITESLSVDNVFGQTSEEQRIQQLKDATVRGEDWETGEAIDEDVLRERERREEEEDAEEGYQDSVLVDPAEMQLSDVEEYPVAVQEDEDEDEDDLEL